MATRFHIPTARVNPESFREVFHRDLLRWYRRHHRQLPWRDTHDPYRIWVSEIMLQQTRVETVLPYYARWLRAFPTVRALARAKSDRVLKLWEGLGYYSRARNLHRAAQTVVRDHGGKLPRTAETLRQLPGIGRYTAGAIASIAFGERTPLVDGNVARVFARIFAITDNVKAPRTLEALWQLAEELIPDRNPGDFNQALMELGALLCTPANPQCEICPMRRVCIARTRGLIDQLPNRGRPQAAERVVVNAALVRRNGSLLMQRRPERGLLAGMWELPTLGHRRFRKGKQLLELCHTITNRRITLRIFACECASTLQNELPPELRWVSAAKMTRLSLPAAHRRAIEQILSAE
jgi:A/G-specific adenine glycosylase